MSRNFFFIPKKHISKNRKENPTVINSNFFVKKKSGHRIHGHKEYEHLNYWEML